LISILFDISTDPTYEKSVFHRLDITLWRNQEGGQSGCLFPLYGSSRRVTIPFPDHQTPSGFRQMHYSRNQQSWNWKPLRQSGCRTA